MNYPMGLDKDFARCLNGFRMIKLLLSQLGFGHQTATDKGLASLLGRGNMGKLSPIAEERRRFEAAVREQFVELKEKGLSISVFTL
ncbi:hypothetical protein A2Z00_05695 [Candidatus Gottesmanbacteria bacterium RBG_13_45_10]|uniref:Uncharacterized protein n=1 Tax=Candidatus Gottesmanbacteria bacterium RBG_13_45_10 TaxID=1798370 RepID=A0A1F5ZGG9_9BACT|nr:MAG: hypothetical protein A2Z00_05695 [Candidatus Gottesmanbacteria bacterium RBG_13_45_10]